MLAQDPHTERHLHIEVFVTARPPLMCVATASQDEGMLLSSASRSLYPSPSQVSTHVWPLFFPSADLSLWSLCCVSLLTESEDCAQLFVRTVSLSIFLVNSTLRIVRADCVSPPPKKKKKIFFLGAAVCNIRPHVDDCSTVSTSYYFTRGYDLFIFVLDLFMVDSLYL